MKNYFVIISIMIIFLVPLNVSVLADETTITSTEIQMPTDESYSKVSAVIRNSNGELVGIINYTVPISSESANRFAEPELHAKTLPQIPAFPVLEMVKIDGKQHQKSLPIRTEQILDADNCDDGTKPHLKNGIFERNGVCYFYLSMISASFGYTIENNDNLIHSFVGPHHGFILEYEDSIKILWTIFVPTD